MFLPTTPEEVRRRGWTGLDVILVTGDTYIDSPYHGAAVVGQVLVKEGFRVGIVSQPRTDSIEDIACLGEPALFWGISAGCVDSMVARRRTRPHLCGWRKNRTRVWKLVSYQRITLGKPLFERSVNDE